MWAELRDLTDDVEQKLFVLGRIAELRELKLQDLDGAAAALLRFRDAPRADGKSFVSHLGPAHRLDRVMLVSGDRESEVRWLADTVGITEVHAGIQPEGKLAIVEEAARQAPVVFVGDGINDAPALAAATVGVAMGAAFSRPSTWEPTPVACWWLGRPGTGFAS